MYEAAAESGALLSDSGSHSDATTEGDTVIDQATGESDDGLDGGELSMRAATKLHGALLRAETQIL